MATIKYLLQSAKENASIYLRFSISAKVSLKRKTRETINPNDWNAKKGEPKNIQSGNREFLKSIKDKKETLLKLESYVLEQYRTRQCDEIINGIWLDEVITAYYSGGRKIQQLDYLDNYLEYYQKEVLPFKKIRGQRISESTIKKHISIIRKIKEFLESLNRRLKV